MKRLRYFYDFGICEASISNSNKVLILGGKD